MLVSQQYDHLNSFNRNRELASRLRSAVADHDVLPSHGSCLMDFYAAESGLKYLLNRVSKVPFGYEVDELGMPADAEVGFPGKVERYSHNLPRMLSRLKVAAAAVSIPPGPFHVVGGYGGGQEFDLQAAHEAWRYGLTVDTADQARLEAFLAQAVAYVEGEI